MRRASLLRVGPPSQKEESFIMSVRMALTKLCACTCGGALLGTGAVQVSEAPRTAQVQSTKYASGSGKTYKKKHRARKIASGAPARKVKRTRQVKTTTRTTTTTTPTVVTVINNIPGQPQTRMPWVGKVTRSATVGLPHTFRFLPPSLRQAAQDWTTSA